ncbi:protein GrpE [Adhaeribacter aerolatus]|uniref:Protein GrpE n=1 Tax=Adhaeribacter aerolatus TaxID=670289 RepID=A0A512AU06_9BACT|nr:nucleotide exchange factor GrpE [Adhaeribacter aerolatus]GEO03195.1 protein GrpE [Adhaeribacter aerolatus]
MSADKNNLPEEEQQGNNASSTETSTVEEHSLPDHGEAATDPVAKLEEELSDMKDKYLRLYSEFDNYKRRTSKERLDMLKTANQEMVVALLPVIDDFDRARQSMEQAQDVAAVKEGVDLIYNKLFSILQQKGLKPMEAVGSAFDADVHEAITQIPAPDESQKGKVIDEVEKGYYLHDKVIRFAKVVIGA